MENPDSRPELVIACAMGKPNMANHRHPGRQGTVRPLPERIERPSAAPTKTFKILWTRRDLECDHFRGAGSSLIIWNNLLINNHDGADLQYVFALDKQTGKTFWKTTRSVDFQDLDPDGKPSRTVICEKATAPRTSSNSTANPL